jgi:hypothetical protein
MTDDASAPLRLRAADEEDLAILSACLQDALVAVGDMAFRDEEREFVLVANRVRWEMKPDEKSKMPRILAGITVENVTGARRRGIDPRRADQLLALLAIRGVPEGIELTFAGGGAVQLQTSEIRIRLQDFGEEWPGLWCPRHKD